MTETKIYDIFELDPGMVFELLDIYYGWRGY